MVLGRYPIVGYLDSEGLGMSLQDRILLRTGSWYEDTTRRLVTATQRYSTQGLQRNSFLGSIL